MTDSLLRHFRLKTNPFSRDAPKDAVLKHQGFVEALERLRLTVEVEATAMLVSEPGCGKSLLLGELASGWQHNGLVVHYFAHATVGPFGLINVLARKAGIAPRRSRAETAHVLSDSLLQDERKHVLILDEVHIMPDDTLEDVRLLSIADFDRKSPFVLVLAGHPALDDRLVEPVHHALDQRITTIARLAPLSLDETRGYMKQRVDAAGARGQPLFDDDAVTAVFDVTGGVPRRINRIATSAMIVAASRKRHVVNAQDVQDARVDRGRA
jgi:type II secretory pathway predicted ATPase ExeA